MSTRLTQAAVARAAHERPPGAQIYDSEAQGSEVSRRRLFEDHRIERRIGDRFLEARSPLGSNFWRLNGSLSRSRFFSRLA